mmetsp:Transcript_58654/g.155106  ORF Transcript_58654/g.155106 Transcript_58654/m.155106 type:complete len:119 (-) Transcript_58654:9-365(-)
MHSCKLNMLYFSKESPKNSGVMPGTKGGYQAFSKPKFDFIVGFSKRKKKKKEKKHVFTGLVFTKVYLFWKIKSEYKIKNIQKALSRFFKKKINVNVSLSILIYFSIYLKIFRKNFFFL